MQLREEQAGALTVEQEFRRLSGLTRLLLWLLILGIVLNVAAEYSSWLQLRLLLGGPFSDAEGAANDLRERIISRTGIGVMLATLLVFGTWIVRAHSNLPALGAEKLDVRPGWAVGYFFIPILNLWKPYTAMRTLWMASHRASRWELEEAPWWLVAWWVLWLIAPVLGRIAQSAATNATTSDAWVETTKLYMVADAVSIPLYGLAALLVHRIWKAQLVQYESRLDASANAQAAMT